MKKNILLFFKENYYILTGLLIFLSFPSYDIWLLKGFTFFAWISLIPLFIYIRDKSYKEILISSFIAGFIGIYFVLNWVGNFAASVKGGYYIALGFLIPSSTIYFITRIVIAEFLSRRFPAISFLIYPSIWIIMDWIQSIGFIAFPWTYWGYSQFQFTSFIQISSYTGIMGVTFILIMFNKIFSDFLYMIFKKEKQLVTTQKVGSKTAISPLKAGKCHSFFKQMQQSYISFKTTENKNLLLIIGIVLLVLVYGYVLIHKHKISGKKDIRLAIIQTCISPWENWRENRFKYLEYLEYYTKESLKHDPDMVIWSESATLENISYHYQNANLNEFERKVFEFVRSSRKPLLTGEIGIIEDVMNKRYYPQNNAVLIDENSRVVDTYAKINLVPFGEWFPYEKWFPFLKELLIKFGASNFVPGDKPLLFNILNKKFGVLVCYEGIFYRLCRKYKELGADFLVNITNDGWSDSYAGHMQHFAAAKFRAVENGIWFARAGNTGFTVLIDPYGRILYSIPILKRGYLIADIDFDQNHETFYSKNGDIFLYFCMAFVFVLFIISFYKYLVKLHTN